MTFDSKRRKPETVWRRDGDWKARYSKLYSSRGISLPKKEKPCRISFMSNDSTPYTTLLMKLRASRQECSNDSVTACLTSLLTERSECYGSRQGSQQSGNLAGPDTLLDMVRSRRREAEDEVKDQPLALPCHEIPNEENENDVCIHGYNYNFRTERSMSRSRVSRISTRRDMDIPSILAFTSFTPAPPVCLGIPAFQKIDEKQTDIPRWSIRRSVCPVCSQKWKDRSSIKNVKYSGLKRNSSMDLPSIIAPARLHTPVEGYVPRPVLAAEDKEDGIVRGGFRNGSASWQLTRARRFRTPKPQPPPPEATAPPSCNAPTARKDLDLRVSRFISDEFRRS